ncbi:ankyrin repeat domain-containing protein [Alicyclobacillus sp. ALC3]|uniref:ankyrin repeat domain-containing protein n=1 Tax=Alicyclobacillus sp. ALC3 TaxID=2796143 RepID=UPI00237949F8|nr:ankyrin repeat domain-containing protein [Alicyclobacillus sp. ALC3]WDL95958.1 ankyrin repeat domain-containing protein [Alicyclobacillus sp. ALC3]
MAQVDELMKAVKANDADRVSNMLAEDASLVNAQVDGNTVLLTAAYYGSKDVIPVLLRHEVDVNFFEAAAIGQIEAVKSFLETDSSLLNTYSHDGFTALGLASFFGHGEIVRELLARGADVHAVSRNEMTVMALHSAVAHGHTNIAAMLLEHGADVNAKQHSGFTPLLEAVHNEQKDMIELLVEHGADVHLAKDDGETPLALARQSGNGEAIAILTRAGGM